MALPVITAGLRVAMAIAKRAGKKLVKKGSKGYKLKKTKHPFESNISTDFTKYAAPIPKKPTFGKIRRKSFGPYGFKKHAASSAVALASSIKKGVSTAIPEATRHLKFYKKVISPTGSQFKHLIARPTFGQRQLLNVRAGSKFAGEYVTKTTKGMKLRTKLLKGGLFGGYIGYRTLKD
jgi:hypothetical protein